MFVFGEDTKELEKNGWQAARAHCLVQNSERNNGCQYPVRHTVVRASEVSPVILLQILWHE